MNRLLVAIVVIIALSGAGAVQAQEDSGVSLGVKMWVNTWTHDAPGAGTVTSDAATLFGPTFEARFGERLFLEAAYLVSLNDYDFGNAGVGGFPPPPGTAESFSRADTEALAGVFVAPGVGLLAGYKYSTFEDKAAGVEDRLFGPLIGVRGIGRIDRNISLYGTLEYLFAEFKQADPTGSLKENSPGWIFEFGLKAIFTQVVSANFGYKFETNTGNDSDVTDSFSGLTAGMQVAF